MEKCKMTDFARMVELLDLRVRYDDLVINSGLILPYHVRGVLTIEKAEWIFKNAHLKNANNSRYVELTEVAAAYHGLAMQEDEDLQDAL